MQAILTHFVGPSNVKGSRYIATNADGKRAIVATDHALDSFGNHWRAAEALCIKLGWHGIMQSGATARGYAFVFVSDPHTPGALTV
jgi:hypothetical protein